MQILRIESANPIPEAQHKLHVVLRVVVDTPAGPVEKSREVPVRKAFYESLTATKKLAYATEAHRWHHLRDTSVRDAWDADDKAVADAAAAEAKAALAAAKAEQEAKFLFVATGITPDKEGKPAGITATVQHHGRNASFTVPYTTDKAALEAALREAFAAWETEQLAKEAFLASMSQTA